LTVAAIVSLAVGLYEDLGAPPTLDANGNPEPDVRWVEGVAIIVAIVLVVTVGSVNDYQKEKQFRKLNAKKEDRDVRVRFLLLFLFFFFYQVFANADIIIIFCFRSRDLLSKP
jgi:magnesium-transporting ATPase (P-type)